MARAARLETWLSNLPLEFLLAHQCRHMEATAEVNPAKTDLPQDRPKLMRLIKSKTQLVSAMLAPLQEWLSRRPFLQRLRTAFIQLRRQVTVRALCLALRLVFKVTRSRGTQPPSVPCSMSLSKAPNKPVSNAVVRKRLQLGCLIELSKKLPLDPFTQEVPSVPWLSPDPARQQR